MSYNVEPLQVCKTYDPVVNLGNHRSYCVFEGGSENSFKPVVSTSFSNSSWQFSAPPPNPAIIVDRNVYIQVGITLTFTGTTSSGFLLTQNLDALRAFPLNSIIDNLQVTLNNTSVSGNIDDYLSAILRYHNSVDQRHGKYSLTPSYLDKSQNYSDLNGSNRNPLGTYYTSSGQEELRGAFPMQILTNTSTSASVYFVLTEPLFLSPFLFGDQEESGFIGLQTMDFNFSINANAPYRLWSHFTGANNAVFSNISMAIGGPNPTLLFRYITPKSLMSIPRSISYPYFTVDRYPTLIGNVNANSSVNAVQSANIQLNSIPRRMYIFARNQNSVLFSNTAHLYTDTFMAINNISLNFNNRSGLMSSCTQADLYNISKRNGVDMSAIEWGLNSNYGVYPPANSWTPTVASIGTVGSVLAIDFAQDIGLQNDEAPGLLGTYQLQFQVGLTNINQSNAVSAMLYCVIISEGTFTIENNRAITQIGVISKQDVLNTFDPRTPIIDYTVVRKVFGGANAWQNFKSFLGKAYDVLKKALPYIDTGRQVVKAITGVGEGGAMRRRKPVKQRRRGGVLIGGSHDDDNHNVDDYEQIESDFNKCGGCGQCENCEYIMDILDDEGMTNTDKKGKLSGGEGVVPRQALKHRLETL